MYRPPFAAQQIHAYPWTFISIGGSAAGLLYATAAHAPRSAPHIIYPSAVDSFIPFTPGVAWIYATYLLLLPALVLAASRLVEFPAAMRTAVGAALLNAAVYNIWPTRLAARTVAPDGSLLSLIQRLDTPLCAIPSGHVSLPVALACSASLLAVGSASADQRDGWTRVAVMFAVWALLLALSTLLTKQHYAVDVAADAVSDSAVHSFSPESQSGGVLSCRDNGLQRTSSLGRREVR